MTSVHCQPRNTELRDSIIKIEFFFRLKSNENTFYGIVDPLVYFWPHVQRYIILCRQGSTPGEGGGGGIVLRISSDGEAQSIFWV